jgi:hypothetical protein
MYMKIEYPALFYVDPECLFFLVNLEIGGPKIENKYKLSISEYFFIFFSDLFLLYIVYITLDPESLFF